jgi:hypothetical protein
MIILIFSEKKFPNMTQCCDTQPVGTRLNIYLSSRRNNINEKIILNLFIFIAKSKKNEAFSLRYSLKEYSSVLWDDVYI